MKKKELLTAFAVVALLSGCQKELPFGPEELKIVYFGNPQVEMSSVTKAGGLLETTSLPEDWDFKVSAFDYIGDDARDNIVIDADRVSYSAQWSATGAPYYWPVGNVDKDGSSINTDLNMIAFAPATTLPGTFAYDDSLIISSTGISGSLTVDKDTANQVDFLYSAPADFSKGNNVKLTFKHGMTNVVFKAKASAEYGTGTSKKEIQIVSIKLNNVYSKGSFVTSDTIAWTPSTPITYSINNTNHNSSTFVDSTATSYTSGLTLTTSYQQFGDKHIFIPQALSEIKGSNSRDAVTADVTVIVNGMTYYYKDIELTSLQDAVDSWEEGRRVTYNLTVGLTEIVFDAPVVTDWDDDSASKEF